MAIPERLQKWRDTGHYIDFKGMKIWVHTSGPKSDDGVLVCHGFPGSSWDWDHVAPLVANHAKIVVPDMIGYGMSAKPKEDLPYRETFSLFNQADLMEEVAKQEGLKTVVLAIHDMGQTVGAELMARHEEGKLSFKIRYAVVFSGSTLVDLISLTPLHKKMLSVSPILDYDLEDDTFSKGMEITFSKEHPSTQEIKDCMDAQIFENHGSRVMPACMRYLLERKKYLKRWERALCGGFQSAPQTCWWGLQDPAAPETMVDRIKRGRPYTEVHKWPDVAHWAMIEVPDRVADAILQGVNSTGTNDVFDSVGVAK